MTRKFLFIAFAFVTVFSFSSCDKDFNELGTNIIGDDNYGFNKDTIALTASSFATGPVQSNNLDINPLGIYDDPNFGTTKASFVTQVQLANVDPTIGVDPEVTSVELTIPYFSTLQSTDVNGDNTYTLDSIYNPGGKIDLEVYRSGYFLRTTNESLEPQIYYSDMGEIDAQKIGDPLNDAAVPAQNDAFFFDPAEHEESVTEDDETTVTRTAPGMRLALNKDVFKNAILTTSSGNLLNNNVFSNHFRGLYFKVKNSGTERGAMSMLNFKAGKITIKYKENGTTAGVRVDKTIVLNLTGNTVSLIEREAPAALPQNRLLLKGGDGYVSTIDLDLGENSSQLALMRSQGWLVNEASLIFNVDKSRLYPGTDASPDDNVDTNPEPVYRIYLYDLETKQPILDYYLDNTTLSDPKFNKYVHSGLVEKVAGDDNNKLRYKIRITNYIRSIISSDSTAVKLGLSVTESIAKTTMARLKNDNANLNNYIPVASVMNPYGTVIYPPNLPATDPNYDKRLQVVIYYTKPNLED